jgi:capsular exopolysaccharide synthesis family protein
MTEPSEERESQGLVRPAPEGSLLPVLRSFTDEIEEEPERRLLWRIRRALRRRGRAILLTGLIFAALAALQVFTATPLYRAASTLQIDPERVEGGMAGGEGETAPPPVTGREYLRTQAAKVESRALAARVVERLGIQEGELLGDGFSRGWLLEGYLGARAWLARQAGRLPFVAAPAPRASDADAVDGLRSLVDGRPLRRTRLVQVSFDAPDPQRAAEVANAYAEEFVEQHLAGRFEADTQATEFLRRRVAEQAEAVEEAEDQLRSWAGERGIVDLDRQLESARQELTDAERELRALDQRMAGSRARFETLRNISADELPASLQSPRIQELEGRATELKARLAGFSDRYGPEWPAVKETRRELAEVEQELESASQGVIDGVIQEVQGGEARRAALQRAINRLRARVDELSGGSVEYNALRRDVETGREVYDNLLESLRAAGGEVGMQSSNVSVVDRAAPPARPTLPRKTWSLLAALVGGLLLGSVWAVGVETRDRPFGDRDDVEEALRLPVLGLTPALESGQGGWWRFGRKRKGREEELPTLAFVQKDESDQEAREAYEGLRSALMMSSPGSPPQMVLVTAAEEGAGTSTTAVNTAIALAESGARTVVIDLNLRRPVLGELFGLEEEQGMSTFLTGNSDMASQIVETSFANLFLVPAGPEAPNPALLLGSDRMELGIELLREYFTHIVIDSPASLRFADALLLSLRVDGVLLVVRRGSTPRGEARRARNLFSRVGSRVFGVVLNGVRPSRG